MLTEKSYHNEVEDEATQIAYTDALQIEPDFEVGEEVSQEIKVEDLEEEIYFLRQNLQSRILELEKDGIYKSTKKGLEISFRRSLSNLEERNSILDDDGNELILPKSEQIPSDYFRKGDTLRAVVLKVDLETILGYYLSRTAPEFLERLFELEVPEVFDGLITIKTLENLAKEQRLLLNLMMIE